jgi:hypothetical protein
MCTTNIYSYLHPDGRRETVQQPNLCRNSRHGKPCPDNVVFQLPSQFVGSSSAPAGSSYLGGSQLPPSPSYTPRSGTPNYHSGNESDRSHHSGSSRGSKKHGSGIYVSVNGQKVVDLNRSRDRQGRERIVLVDAPRSPRTAPPSPQTPYIVDALPAPRERSASRHRPVIVNDRPQFTMDLPAARHTRHSSSSSHESRHSHRSSHSDEEERERRRERRREERRREEHDQKIRMRIAEANKKINSRPAAPTPPAPPRFVRPAVEVANPDAEAAREEEAQRQRLLDRMQPRRRATVSNSSRRTKVLYDDGVYRWE